MFISRNEQHVNLQIYGISIVRALRRQKAKDCCYRRYPHPCRHIRHYCQPTRSRTPTTIKLCTLISPPDWQNCSSRAISLKLSFPMARYHDGDALRISLLRSLSLKQWHVIHTHSLRLCPRPFDISIWAGLPLPFLFLFWTRVSALPWPCRQLPQCWSAIANNISLRHLEGHLLCCSVFTWCEDNQSINTIPSENTRQGLTTAVESQSTNSAIHTRSFSIQIKIGSKEILWFRSASISISNPRVNGQRTVSTTTYSEVYNSTGRLVSPNSDFMAGRTPWDLSFSSITQYTVQ